MKDEISFLEYKAYKLRLYSLLMTSEAGSGHLTSALSAADMVAAIFFHAMHYNLENPYDPNNDRFILSKGHAIPVVYAAWKEKGVLTEEDLLKYREIDSPLEGHPTARFIYNEAATGSLGQGLSIGLGMAFAARFSKRSYYTYVMLGDSEMSEGSNWEAIEIAAHYKIDNLIALVDLNRLGQSTESLYDHHVQKHASRWKAFGWHTLIINGHDMKEIVDALDKAKTIRERPCVIVAKTFKGYGINSVENKEGYHGKALPKEKLPELINQLQKRFDWVYKPEYEQEKVIVPKPYLKIQKQEIKLPKPNYKKGDSIATRKVYGETLAVLGNFVPELLSLDAEVKNSTFAEIFEKKFPHRFLQCFIAEQNMIGMATGLTLRGYIPFSSTFASFLTRAHDQIRMAAIGQVPLRVAGSHSGVSIGQDGPSQMGLEDICQMRALPQSVILYPSDAVSAYKLVNAMVNYNEGISYIRLTRGETSVIYDNNEDFSIGGCKVLKEGFSDKACVIAAGITVHEALKAYEELKKEGINITVIDLYSVKPLDYANIIKYAIAAQKKVVTVEDHYIQGGLSEAVCYALRNEGIKIESLAIRILPRSGKPEELLAMYQIDSSSIIKTVKSII